ncbi:hypothetical protein M8J75_012483 [Diaphorina citri]|nr:hypothetical protein M8J75_012483 [Diaphorina citri]
MNAFTTSAAIMLRAAKTSCCVYKGTAYSERPAPEGGIFSPSQAVQASCTRRMKVCEAGLIQAVQAHFICRVG